MVKFLTHQVEVSDAALSILRAQGLAYIFGQPRSGKTATSIRVCELSKRRRILVLTPKNAITGWHSELARTGAAKSYTVTNFEQTKKLDPSDYDFAIVDEAHRLGKVGKPTQRVKDVRALTFNLPVLFLSGMPLTETPLAIYYQFCVTRYSPFKHKNFYDFFREYGEPSPIRLHGRWVETYKKARPSLLEAVEPFVVRMTQVDAGITHAAVDKLHTVPLLASTKELIANIKEDKVITLNGKEIAFESDMAERLAVHQCEYGGLKVGEEYVDLPNDEVVQYILNTWSDTPDLALMCHYKSTRLKLEKHFKHAQLFSSTAHAEGVSLADFKHFVIVGTCFSGAKHVQRRERGININKRTDSVVHHIVTDSGISKAVYDTVSRKRDFNLSLYRSLR